MTDAERDDLLRAMAKNIAEMRSAMARGVGAMASALGLSLGGGGSEAFCAVASAAELDGQYGDIEIRKDPPRWQGDSFAGRTMSQTTPEYLDCLSDFKDWSAKKDDDSGAKDNKGRPKSTWAKRDARLARGWAARMRSGWKPNGGGAGPKEEDYGEADGDIPFISCSMSHDLKRWSL